MKKNKNLPVANNIAKKPRTEAQLAVLRQNAFKAGEVGNPAGRPKGSRNRFAEQFVQDFLADWEANGAQALADCRVKDVAAYINAASKLLPKDFNINMTSEANLDKFLEQFDDNQLKELLTGLVALGASSGKETAKTTARNGPDSVH